MNYLLFGLARALGMVLIFIPILVIYMIAGRIGQRPVQAALAHLGAEVSEGGIYQLHWFIWPPHYQLSGRFSGRPFYYEIQKPQVSHLYMRCNPHAALQYDARRRGERWKQALDFPRHPVYWSAFVASPKNVPILKRSADRRPLGFGDKPGVDLHREGAPPYDAELLREDLTALAAYCTQAP